MAPTVKLRGRQPPHSIGRLHNLLCQTLEIPSIPPIVLVGRQIPYHFRLQSSSSSRRSDRQSRTSVMSSSSSTTSSTLATQSLQEFCTVLASKQPTPGGGASAAVGAALGAGAAAMSAAYTQRKKDQESGSAQAASTLIEQMDVLSLLNMADDDVSAYQDLQSTWKKDSELTPEQVQGIQDRALRVPTVLVEACHQRVLKIRDFLPRCNPNITSDAKVGIHQLAGAARAAYQTVLVNSPPDEEKARLTGLLREMQDIENELLGL